MFVVKKFLCCCPLDTGAVIIGNICILLSFLSIYELNRNCESLELITWNGMEFSPQAFIELLAAIIMILVSFLLIIGAMKQQQTLIKLWLIVVALYIILECAITTATVFLPEIITLNGSIVEHFFITLFILSYFWYCVYQFDQQLGTQVPPNYYNVITSPYLCSSICYFTLSVIMSVI